MAGTGTKDDPWQLTTPPGTSAYTMHLDETADPPLLVCQVGSTRLTYLARVLEDLPAMLRWGSVFYSMYFVVSFPNLYRMDETLSEVRWTIGRCLIESSATAMISMLLLDLWVVFFGTIV